MKRLFYILAQFVKNLNANVLFQRYGLLFYASNLYIVIVLTTPNGLAQNGIF